MKTSPRKRDRSAISLPARSLLSEDPLASTCPDSEALLEMQRSPRIWSSTRVSGRLGRDSHFLGQGAQVSYSRRSGTGPLLSAGCGQTQTDQSFPGSALGFPHSLDFSDFMRAEHATSGSLQDEQGPRFSTPQETQT